ncbi:MAG: amidohydrolase [Alphaproteobacteria bacterium]|nr:MAG: amidohydrolase [Alphaproteobacteria bacterium]
MRGPALFAAAAALALWAAPGAAAPPPPGWLFNDSHFHLTNYVQRGLTMRQYVAMMGTTVKRSTVFGIPLQQTWSYPNSGDYAPTYYLQTDASLYYYSFTDAMIATGYLSLPPEDRARLDPMITGFNPADMYAADHIKRVLQIFPGVFSGIGEFSIHKEFVSGKVAGETASLTDPALDRILDFAGEAGLVAIVHCDIDMPFTKGNQLPLYFAQMRDLLLRHPKTTIIWAHTGLGRVVQPIPAQAGTDSAQRPAGHLELIESLLADPRFSNLYFDISWDEVAKYALSSPQSIERVAAAFERHPDRFLFGTDNVAPPDLATDLKVYEMWGPVFGRLRPATQAAITMGNYERLFDAARLRVRAWERANAS